MTNHVTINEIAQILDCSTKTVRRKVDKGLIPAIQPDGRGTHLRFDIDDVLRAVKPDSRMADSQNSHSKSDVETQPTRKRPGPAPKWKQNQKRKTNTKERQ